MERMALMAVTVDQVDPAEMVATEGTVEMAAMAGQVVPVEMPSQAGVVAELPFPEEMAVPVEKAEPVARGGLAAQVASAVLVLQGGMVLTVRRGPLEEKGRTVGMPAMEFCIFPGVISQQNLFH
jgi:hypothetical protein